MAKKNRTVKELNVDFELLSERVKKLEERADKNNGDVEKSNTESIENVLKGYDEQIERLNRLLDVQTPTKENINPIEVQRFKCKVCNENLKCKNDLKEHMKEKHPKVYRCKDCEKSFVKSSDLETHVKRFHCDTTLYKCDDCSKTFVLEWRLRKHKDIHEENANRKNCHYYNNMKECPFEDLGCMFMHKMSEECKYGSKCMLKLCQFQHKKYGVKNDGKECDVCEYRARNNVDLSKHKKNDHEYQKYDEMNEEDKYEVNELICQKLCWQGDHKCYEIDKDNEFLGIDVEKIKEDFRNCVDDEEFKCEVCEYISSEIKNVKEHFINHHRDTYQLGCWRCEKKCKTILDLRKHIGTYHYTSQNGSESET